MSIISIDKVTKTYLIGGEVPVHALQGVSLDIEAGEFVAIMGSSGSGKSTLLAILGLLDKADSGEYKLLNKNITNLQENDYARLRNQFFGFVFQTFNLLPKLNVAENTILPFIYAGEEADRDHSRAIEVLNSVGLGDRLKHRPNQISGGQQQRVAVARALVNKPLVILADEPTGNLDTKSSQEIMQIIKRLNEQGNTIIMVTHEPDIAAHASRIIRLQDGKIIKDEKNRDHKKVAEPDFFLKKKQASVFSFRRLKDYCFEAIMSLLNNKLRSFLSILGILIGVAAVITMLALGTGAKLQIKETLSGLGTNLLMVRSSSRSRNISAGTTSVVRFDFKDLSSISSVKGVKKVVPYVNGSGQAVYQNKNWSTTILGTDIDYQYVKDAIPEEGRFFTKSEGMSRAKIVVLGKTVADELFGEENPIGAWIKINRVSFQVIGVLPEKGMSGFRNADDQVLIPIKTAMFRLLGKESIDSFDVQVDQPDQMELVQAEITSNVLKNHRLAESETDRIDVRNMAEIQQAASAMMNTFSLLLGGIAAISLLVGGIGIMNIMLVMVMERTHEIGLRKALGAQRNDIMVQFLVESILICLFGGVMGILLGSLISWLASQFAGWNTVISAGSIILSFTFSVLVGLIFGIWPAWRASKLLPIEALRYE